MIIRRILFLVIFSGLITVNKTNVLEIKSFFQIIYILFEKLEKHNKIKRISSFEKIKAT